MIKGVYSGVALQAIILELGQLEATGRLICRIDSSNNKSIRFYRGRVVAASSTLMDDRLGEILFREGKLSLDDFLSSAGKVGQGTRFGDILVSSGLYTPKDLWESLHSQSQSILASLCFYSEIEVTFEKEQDLPQMEFVLQSSLERVFRDALQEYRDVMDFERQVSLNPELEIEERALFLADNDFRKDLVSLIRDSANFFTIVDTTSRLSRVYTIRALYELYRIGLLRDTLGLARRRLAEPTEKVLRGVVEDVNFVFAELKNAALSAGLEDWDAMVEGANRVLSYEIGDGIHVTGEDGFIYENVIRAFVLQPRAREKAWSPYSASWPRDLSSQLADAIHTAILFLFFELYNRKRDSEDFGRIKGMLEQMGYLKDV